MCILLFFPQSDRNNLAYSFATSCELCFALPYKPTHRCSRSSSEFCPLLMIFRWMPDKILAQERSREAMQPVEESLCVKAHQCISLLLHLRIFSVSQPEEATALYVLSSLVSAWLYLYIRCLSSLCSVRSVY